MLHTHWVTTNSGSKQASITKPDDSNFSRNRARTWLRGIVILATLGSLGANHETRNFRVHAPTEKIAKLVGAAAEHHRSRLGQIWYGHRIGNWGTKCDVTVNVDDRVGASGTTKFRFSNGEVYDWRMEVNGPLERILDSVVPHEVNHTILACWFRRKVPRWADEGCATLVEHESEQSRQTKHVEHLMREGRRIPLRMLLGITRYPSDSRQLMALYAQGYSLTRFLIEKHGRRQFLMFLKEAHHRGWDRAIETYYGSSNIEGLEQQWAQWVIAGSPRLNLPDGELLAGTDARRERTTPVVRAQNSEPKRTSFLDAPEPRFIGDSVPTMPAANHKVPGNGRRSPQVWRPVSTIARVAQLRMTRTAPSQAAVVSPAALQPLALTRIDRSTIPIRHDVRDPLRGSIRSQVTVPQPDLRAFDSPGELTQPILRETRLRELEPEERSAGAFDWERFPSRVPM